jgi:hypothetical protein
MLCLTGFKSSSLTPISSAYTFSQNTMAEVESTQPPADTTTENGIEDADEEESRVSDVQTSRNGTHPMKMLNGIQNSIQTRKLCS